MNFQEKLKTAFQELRRIGYFAEQDFRCCQTCGCYDVPDDKENSYVFYHHQDHERLVEGLSKAGMAREDVGVYLSWGGDPNVIRKAFEDAGCEVNHNGDAATRIWICDTAVN